MMMRLDKFLADAGVGTRTDLKAMIRHGRVTVDGAVIKKPEQKVSEQQKIRVDGVQVQLQGTVVLLLHKPAGYVTSTSDPRDRTVMELLPPEYQTLFPLGRLDKETEGLLSLPTMEIWGIGSPVPSTGLKRNITPKPTGRLRIRIFRHLQRALH